MVKTFADYEIKVDESKTGNQKTLCPKCSHTRENKTDPCLYVDAQKGVWNCYNCEWKGSLNNGNGNGFNKKIEAIYKYKDAEGMDIYETVRFTPKDFRQRRSNGNGGYIWNLQGVKRLPFMLPALIASDEAAFIPGGEKDCLDLIKAGKTATTNAGGEGNWKPELNEYLKDRDVVILEDNDEKGQKHGRVVSESLYGIAKSIKIVRFPELPHNADVSNFLAEHSIEELEARVKDAPLFNGSYSNYFADSEQPNILERLETWKHIQSLEIKVEWIIDRLIPKESIIIEFGKGGIGKTWVTMDMARSIGLGIPFLGYQTVKTPVIFIDFENPLAVLNTRTQKLGDAENVYFWRANGELKAPSLDSPDWTLYKQLPEGAVLIFDTLRASHSKDENASDQVAVIKGRMKELRDMGFTVILLHHTAKNSDKMAKGSTAIVDLADHILGLTKVKQAKDGQDTVVDDDESEDDPVYRFGTRQKTRFEPHHIYLTLNPERGFELAPDPEEEFLKDMHRILVESGSQTKTAFASDCKKVGLGLKKAKKLIDHGSGRYWKTQQTGAKNSILVTPIQLGSSAPLYRGEQLPNRNDPEQPNLEIVI